MGLHGLVMGLETLDGLEVGLDGLGIGPSNFITSPCQVLVHTKLAWCT